MRTSFFVPRCFTNNRFIVPQRTKEPPQPEPVVPDAIVPELAVLADVGVQVNWSVDPSSVPPAWFCPPPGGTSRPLLVCWSVPAVVEAEAGVETQVNPTEKL